MFISNTNVKALRLVSLIDVEIIYLLIKVEGISEFIEAGLSVFVFCSAMTYWCNCCVQICFSFDIYVLIIFYIAIHTKVTHAVLPYAEVTVLYLVKLTLRLVFAITVKPIFDLVASF